MTDWVDLVNGGATAAVGIAGIVGTYFGSRSASREARQHTRLEGIYEGLTSVMMEIRFRVRAVDQGKPRGLTSETEAELVERFRDSASNLQLYAGQQVVDASATGA